MLVLTRRVGEKIIIGGDIEVAVLAVKDGHVKIGIDAPRDVSVNRAEIQERIDNGIPIVKR